MNNKAKVMFLAAALLLFLIPGIGAVYSATQRAVDKSRNPEKEYRNIMYAGEYPFQGAEPQTTAVNERDLCGNYLKIADKLTSLVDNYSGKYNVVAPFFLDFFGKTSKILGYDYMDDAERPVVRLKNGYLTYAQMGTQDEITYDGVVDFDRWLKEKNISFLMVIPADKADERYAVYPKGFSQKYGDEITRFFQFLDENGIIYLNSTERLIAENEDFYSRFYKTDHHWNVSAGLTVATAIAERLKTEFGQSVDTQILDRTNFEAVTYESVFLGSQGKKVTNGYISREDFTVYYPRFETSFEIELPNWGIDRIGAFEDTLIYSEALKDGDYYKKDTYTAFLYGDVPLARIHNLNCQNGTRVLMLKTSEANVVDTYLAFSVEYLDIIDLRHFDGSVRSFIEKTYPDVVLTCSYPSRESDQKMRDVQ